MVKIIKQIVSPGIINARSYGYGNPCNFITVHQTGNKNVGADAQAHANIQSKLNPRQASWQYEVDDSEIIQSFPDEVMCWAATDGRGKGNTESVHVEICINSDGDYKKAIQNAADLVRHLLDKHNLSVDDVKQHHDWYDKNCPQQLREGHEGITWDDFIGMVNGVFDRDEKVKSLQIEKDSKPKANLKVDGKWGNKTTSALQRYFDTIVDGIISGQPENFTTRNIPSVKFGEGGSMLIETMQEWLGTPADKIITDPSRMIEALQKRFNMRIVDSRISFPSNVVMEMQRRLNRGKL